MVYRGKPSKACLPCRRRKLVCDLKEEGCSQCRRAKLVCHGYRDTDALRVNDESISVQRKVQGFASNSTSKSKSKSLAPSPQTLIPVFRHAGAIPQSLAIPMASQAKDLFYYNYVVGILKPFDFLQTLCSPTSKDEHLTTSMDAVALAYLNYQRHAPDAQSDARRSYVAALRLMNKAIEDPELVKKDSTMLAILLLDLYEKITNKEPYYEGAWAAHLQGALTLVKVRGDQQFDDPIAVRMLVRVTTNEIISCVASHRPVSEEILALRANIASHSATPDPKLRESDLMIEFARLRHEIEDGDMPDGDAIASIIELDGRFLALSLNVQSTWQFRTVQVEEKSSHHWESYHHVYPYEQIAQMWNVLRITRILLNELILSRYSDVREVRSPSSKTPSLRQQATETIENMASDICATIPQYIGDLSSTGFPNLVTTRARTHTLASGTAKSKENFVPAKQTTSPNPTHHLPCYRLIFPLYVAAQSCAAPPALRPWAIEQLRFMAEYHAIENAARVANILQSADNRDPWLVYAMLGSYAFVC
jgi:hypothetical protein